MDQLGLNDHSVDKFVWRTAYRIERKLQPMVNYLRYDMSKHEVKTMYTWIKAEILKVEGANNNSLYNHAIEFRLKDGNPQLYQEHIQKLTEHFEQIQFKTNIGKSFL